MVVQGQFIRYLVLSCVLILCPAKFAAADWLFSPFVGIKFKGQSNFLALQQGAEDTKLTFVGNVAILTDGIFGVELDVGYLPRFFDSSDRDVLVIKSNVTTVTGNLILAAPKSLTRESLRPYMVVGFGLLHASVDDVLDLFDVERNLSGIAIGFGALGGITDQVSLRFDLRQFRSLGKDLASMVGFGETGLKFWRASVGVTFTN